MPLLHEGLPTIADSMESFLWAEVHDWGEHSELCVLRVLKKR
jgi:hypothetical protein